jgi:hypothetical protein
MLSFTPGGALGGPGEEVWPPKNKMLLFLFTAPQGQRIFMTRLRFWLGAYVKFQPVGWPGWAWGGLGEVWWEGVNARGSRPKRGASPKNICIELQSFHRLNGICIKIDDVHQFHGYQIGHRLTGITNDQ